MTDIQAKALADLANALTQATNTGLFDYLCQFMHPDVINTFCDGIMDAVNAEPPQPKDSD